jgi:O-antigen/teichoic acid export membrane protein
VPYRFARSTVERATARELGALAGYVSLTEAAAAAIYAIDRVILGLFRSAATVGLFEGPVRAHNLIRALNAAITTTALPAGSRYYAESDQRRLRELLLRGSRYTLALVVPLAVVGMTLAGPILDVWLGARFREAGSAMAIMLSHWLVNGCAGLAAAILIACGRARELARYALTVACGNIALALILTPMLGLDGIALATAVPYLAAFPLLLRMTLSVVPVSLAELLSTSFVPAYVLGAVLAGGLVALRLLVPLETLEAVVATALGALAAYWAAFFVVWMGPEERELVLVVARLRRPR